MATTRSNAARGIKSTCLTTRSSAPVTITSRGTGCGGFTRFELRSQIGNRTTTLFELSDGNYVWTFRENPAATTLTRVDLQRVAQALEQSRHAAPANAAREPAIGELPKLLEGIADDFRFERVVEGRLGDRPVWIVEGSWKPEKLIEAMPDQKGNIEAGRPLDLKRLPAQLPERIVLSIGQTDLFPCRVEYLRRKSNSATGGAGQEGAAPGYRAIVSMEWFDVQINRPIDPQKFVYQPTGWTDATEVFLKALNLAPGGAGSDLASRSSACGFAASAWPIPPRTRTASIIPLHSARPCQARSNAVPCATLVRTIGRPSVTFTALCIPSSFSAM